MVTVMVMVVVVVNVGEGWTRRSSRRRRRGGESRLGGRESGIESGLRIKESGV